MNPNKALWEKGDSTRIAGSMRESGEAFVQRLGITKGLKVLDLVCGDGTTAIPVARRGADVLGVDIARNLVEAGNRRALDEGVANCRFLEGGAPDLNELKDHVFDFVVSVFWGDVCAQAVQCGQGDGARHATGGPDCDGQLDSLRPNARGTDSEGQFRMHAVPAGGLHQPDDVGGSIARRSSALPEPEFRKSKSLFPGRGGCSTFRAHRRSS